MLPLHNAEMINENSRQRQISAPSCANVSVYVYYFNATPFQGCAPIMILLLIIGGLIMLMLGTLGEYIWRILDEVKKRPNYIVKDEYL